MNHPAMYVSLVLNGSLVLDVDGRRLTLRFLDALGQVQDHFSIEHGDARSVDYDGDGLPDWWEWWHFDTLERDGALGKDNDGVSHADELEGARIQTIRTVCCVFRT